MIGGVFLFAASIMVTLISFGAYNSAKQDTMVVYIQNRLRQEELKDTDKLMEAVGAKPIQKECPYCGRNNDETAKVCSHCQASI